MLLLFLATTLATSDVRAQTAPEAALAEAVAIYRGGGYAEAAARLNELLYPLKLTRKADILEARVHLGLCHVVLDQREDARAEFERVLDQDPDYSLDPLYTPPDILAFYEDVRATYTPKPQQPQRPAIRPPRRPQRHSIALDLAPLGIAQFRAGRPVHGGLLLGSEIFLGGVATGTWLWLENKTDEVSATEDGYLETAQEELVFTWVKRTNNVAFLANTALLFYGFGDALWRVQTRGPRVSVSPVVPGADVGLGLTLRF